MANYRTTVYPALMLRMYDRQFKFVGGRLRVKKEDAVIIDDFVRAHPEYRISRTDAEEVAMPSPAPNIEHPTLPELRKALKAIGLPTAGTRDELEARLAKGYDEPVVYEGEVGEAPPVEEAADEETA